MRPCYTRTNNEMVSRAYHQPEIGAFIDLRGAEAEAWRSYEVELHQGISTGNKHWSPSRTGGANILIPKLLLILLPSVTIWILPTSTGLPGWYKAYPLLLLPRRGHVGVHTRRMGEMVFHALSTVRASIG